MKALSKIISILLILICGALFIYELIPTVVRAFGNYAVFLWLAIGMVAYFVLNLIPALKKNEDFLQVFAHELSHTLVGLLFLNEIKEFNAKENTGQIIHTQRRFGSLFISLAPYTFPYFTYLILFLCLIIKPEFVYIFEILAGFTWAFHIRCFRKQTGNHQTDISSQGYFRSYAYIVMAHAFNLSIILLSIQDGIISANVQLFTAYWNDLCQAFRFVVGLFNA